MTFFDQSLKVGNLRPVLLEWADNFQAGFVTLLIELMPQSKRNVVFFISVGAIFF